MATSSSSPGTLWCFPLSFLLQNVSLLGNSVIHLYLAVNIEQIKFCRWHRVEARFDIVTYRLIRSKMTVSLMDIQGGLVRDTRVCRKKAACGSVH